MQTTFLKWDQIDGLFRLSLQPGDGQPSWGPIAVIHQNTEPTHTHTHTHSHTHTHTHTHTRPSDQTFSHSLPIRLANNTFFPFSLSLPLSNHLDQYSHISTTIIFACQSFQLNCSTILDLFCFYENAIDHFNNFSLFMTASTSETGDRK